MCYVNFTDMATQVEYVSAAATSMPMQPDPKEELINELQAIRQMHADDPLSQKLITWANASFAEATALEDFSRIDDVVAKRIKSVRRLLLNKVDGHATISDPVMVHGILWDRKTLESKLKMGRADTFTGKRIEDSDIKEHPLAKMMCDWVKKATSTGVCRELTPVSDEQQMMRYLVDMESNARLAATLRYATEELKQTRLEVEKTEERHVKEAAAFTERLQVQAKAQTEVVASHIATLQQEQQQQLAVSEGQAARAQARVEVVETQQAKLEEKVSEVEQKNCDQADEIQRLIEKNRELAARNFKTVVVCSIQ